MTWSTKTHVVCPRSLVLTYPATIPLSRRSLTHLADLLRAHRARRGTRYRRLSAGRQALLVLAHLRNGDTPARLAAGFAVSPTTAWRYIREAVDLLAATAPTLADAMAGIARLAYAILDGTLIRTDRLSGSADRRLYRAKTSLGVVSWPFTEVRLPCRIR
jgi:hypothetical protein